MSTYLEMCEMYPDGPPMWMLPRFDEARAEYHHAVVDAATALADRWYDRHLSDDVGPKFTCGEIAPLIDLLRALGRDDVAESWIEGHGAADDDEYDDHHDIYLSLTEEG